MADTAGAATKADLGPPPSVDVQDPLPEASWFWRRTITFLVVIPSVAVNIGAALFLYWLGSDNGLVTLVKWNLSFAMIAILLYLAGANAAEITKLVQSSSLLKAGVQLHQKATAENSKGKVTAESTAGIADSGLLGRAGDDSQASPVPDSQIPGDNADGAPGSPSVDFPEYAK